MNVKHVIPFRQLVGRWVYHYLLFAIQGKNKPLYTFSVPSPSICSIALTSAIAGPKLIAHLHVGGKFRGTHGMRARSERGAKGTNNRPLTPDT